MQEHKRYTAGLARRLSRATGMSESGVYRCLRSGRRPKNALLRESWDLVMRSSESLPESPECL